MNYAFKFTPNVWVNRGLFSPVLSFERSRKGTSAANLIKKSFIAVETTDIKVSKCKKMLHMEQNTSKLVLKLGRIATAMTTATIPEQAERMSCDEVSPAEIAAVEAALRQLETADHKRILGQIAQWFLVLKMYKHMEVGFKKNPNRASAASQHRALLSALMGIGEWFLNESGEIPPETFALISYSRETLAANIRYLHEKYEQWFVDIDENEVRRVVSAIFGVQE